MYILMFWRELEYEYKLYFDTHFGGSSLAPFSFFFASLKQIVRKFG